MEARIITTGIVGKLLADPSQQCELTRLVRRCIESKETKWDAIAKHVDLLNEMEAHQSDHREDVNQELWNRLTQQVIEDQKYTVGVEEGVRPGSKFQRELLHALDYSDQMWPGAHCFNSCPKCGMCIPAKWGRRIEERRFQQQG